tara:strand:+ start:93 stop:461 length:369 start_codon:yes stop_codon:yes gene_type:complete
MKNFFLITIFSLLSFNVSFADCTDDIDFVWRYGDKFKSFILIDYVSKNDKPIIITNANVYTKDKKIVKQISEDFLLEPFRKSGHNLAELSHDDNSDESVRWISLRGYNTDVIASVGYSCRYK